MRFQKYANYLIDTIFYFVGMYRMFEKSLSLIKYFKLTQYNMVW